MAAWLSEPAATRSRSRRGSPMPWTSAPASSSQRTLSRWPFAAARCSSATSSGLPGVRVGAVRQQRSNGLGIVIRQVQLRARTAGAGLRERRVGLARGNHRRNVARGTGPQGCAHVSNVGALPLQRIGGGAGWRPSGGPSSSGRPGCDRDGLTHFNESLILIT